MATLDNDYVRLELVVNTVNIPLNRLGLEWPPPEKLYMSPVGIREAREGDEEAFTLVRVSCSQLDDETASHPNLARGAEYRYAHMVEPAT